MQRQPFTAKMLEGLQPREKVYSIYDERQPGLRVRVHPTGRKSLEVLKKLHGKAVTVRIATVGELTLPVVRQKATEIVAKIVSGINPNDEKRQRQHLRTAENYTLAEAYEDYIAERPQLREATLRNYEKALRLNASDLMKLPILRLTPSVIRERHREVAKQSEYGANMLVKVFRLLINHAHDKFVDDATGVSRIPSWQQRTMRGRWAPESRRQTFIHKEHMPEWRAALDAMPTAYNGSGGLGRDLLLFLIYTGLRIGETLQLRSEMLDPKAEILIIPATLTKTGKEIRLPLSRQALAIAERRAAKKTFRLFPCSATQGYQKHVVAVSGVSFTPHDLRRTFLSYGAAAGISPYFLKLLVNHAAGNAADITAGYVVASEDDLRHAAQQIAGKIDAAATPSNQTVIPLHSAK
ncbi:MAG: tyrosine-type recombinase/integrase [Hyphomicrobiales bacterium]